ncbi:MAG: glycosyltransferase family 1 protein, partial [Desulfovibrio sp.]|nr:glycosyltransferase family 1 protein [Desulfovibrio sp.]
VWAAGGLLLSDPTKGLELFPKELTAPITIQKPTDLSAKLRELDNNPKFYFELRKNFRQVLQEKHSYTQRIRSIFEAL